MCCGRDEIPLSEIVVAEEVMPKQKAPADKVALYTQIRDMVMTVGGYGQATNTVPVMVPESEVNSLTAEGLLGPEPFEESQTRASRKPARSRR